MAPSKFEYFPLLPKELRDQIWWYVLHNTLDRVREGTRVAHFFTLYDSNAYGELAHIPMEDLQGPPVPASDNWILNVGDDPTRPAGNYALAAPRYHPWEEGTWVSSDAFVNTLGWEADGEDRDVALKWIDRINDPGAHPETDVWLERRVVQQGNKYAKEDGCGPVAGGRKVINRSHQPTTARYISRARTRLLPIYPFDDLVVIQPLLDPRSLDFVGALVRHVDGGGPDDADRRGDVKLWFIDYRIRFREGALLDEEHWGFNRRRAFRDDRCYYVEVRKWQEDVWYYGEKEEGFGPGESRYFGLLGATMGVLGCLRFEDVEDIGYEEGDEYRRTCPLRLNARVKHRVDWDEEAGGVEMGVQEGGEEGEGVEEDGAEEEAVSSGAQKVCLKDAPAYGRE
ncbi:hypothetical protein NKR19_g9670 [Coniochaeta hoffmannii]|uniref:Uncharacterized protein n=1 Tax=Coniochaeta hoffmannii TaxID=91930 RepID=A0AA38VD76_9PEZI|nr:hypothetical protein NKR19_g9670 [Coniochaeta hoffmannii]